MIRMYGRQSTCMEDRIINSYQSNNGIHLWAENVLDLCVQIFKSLHQFYFLLYFLAEYPFQKYWKMVWKVVKYWYRGYKIDIGTIVLNNKTNKLNLVQLCVWSSYCAQWRNDCAHPASFMENAFSAGFPCHLYLFLLGGSLPSFGLRDQVS